MIMVLISGRMGLIFAPILLICICVLASFDGHSNGMVAGSSASRDSIFLPLFYDVLGFIAGAIGALLYNLFARWAGGFELELDVTPED